MTLAVPRSVIERLTAEAARAHPRECCGLLLGEPDGSAIAAVRPAANVAHEPERHFEIDPVALIAAHKTERAGGPRLLGYYHSHPTGTAAPSARDRAGAAGDGRIWAIVGEGRVRLWRDMPGGFEPLSYAVSEG